MRPPLTLASAPIFFAVMTLVASLSEAGTSADRLPDLIVREMELLDHDVVTDGERVLLRLATATANIGTGPLHLVGVLPVPPEGNQLVNQVVFRDDGSSYERPAGSFEYHPTHNHVHLEDWAIYRLRAFLEGGGVGDVVAEGGKTSFCLLDSFPQETDLPGAPLHPVYTSCEGTLQGISVGWADLYHRRLFGQNIDIKGLPQGNYWLEVEVDPENHILEQDEGNNITRVPVEIGEPIFVSGPLELAPNNGTYHPTGKVDLRVGYRSAPRFHRGNNVYFPTVQVLRLSAGGRRNLAFFAAVENEDHHHHPFLMTVSRRRSSNLRWTHFETTGSVKRNVSASITTTGHTVHLAPSATGTFHSITKPRNARRPAQKAKLRRSSLDLRVADGPLIDRVRIDIVP